MMGTTTSAENLKFHILVEQTGEKGFTARALAWPDCVVEAATREEALKLIRSAILTRLARAEIVTIEIRPEEAHHPWLKFAGDWAGDPGIEDFRAAVEQYRREIDAESAPWLLEPEDEPEKEMEAARFAIF